MIEKFTFGEKGKSGWVVDHDDSPAAICFTPNDGDLLLHMTATPCGMCLPGGNVTHIKVEDNDRGQPTLFVAYIGRMGCSDEYTQPNMNLGEIPPHLLDEAKRFVQSVMEAFRYNAAPCRTEV